MFMSPITPISEAISRVCSLILSTILSGRVAGGSTHALSPEWMPASSMCSMIPPITVILPSQTASTSTSTASSRKRSMSTALSGKSLNTPVMNFSRLCAS